MLGIFWVLIVLAVLFILAVISKKIFKTDIFLGVLIMTKTKRFIPFLDKLAKPKKTINILTDVGVVLGFGAFGLDYLLRDKKINKKKRILIFLLTFIILSYISFIGINFLLKNNPIISFSFIVFMSILSGLMGLSGFTLASLFFSAYDILFKLITGNISNAMPGVGLVIPGIKMPKIDLFIPWYGWLILIFSAIVHEFAHGAVLRTFKAKVKSMGFLLAGILPLGAFVEPDDKQLEKKKNRSVIRMLAAGPTSNAILSILFLIILIILKPGFFSLTQEININSTDYVFVSLVDENVMHLGEIYPSPAYGVLEKNDKIISINGFEIKNTENIKPSLKTNENNYLVLENIDTGVKKEVELYANEIGSFGFSVGVKTKPDYIIPKKYFWYKHFYAVIFWLTILNFLISTVNFLPTAPFDGGWMSRIIFEGYLPKKHNQKKRMKKISRFFGTLIVILLLLNIIPYFF